MILAIMFRYVGLYVMSESRLWYSIIWYII